MSHVDSHCIICLIWTLFEATCNVIVNLVILCLCVSLRQLTLPSPSDPPQSSHFPGTLSQGGDVGCCSFGRFADEKWRPHQYRGRGPSWVLGKGDMAFLFCGFVQEEFRTCDVETKWHYREFATFWSIWAKLMTAHFWCQGLLGWLSCGRFEWFSLGGWKLSLGLAGHQKRRCQKQIFQTFLGKIQHDWTTFTYQMRQFVCWQSIGISTILCLQHFWRCWFSICMWL